MSGLGSMTLLFKERLDYSFQARGSDATTVQAQANSAACRWRYQHYLKVAQSATATIKATAKASASARMLRHMLVALYFPRAHSWQTHKLTRSFLAPSYYAVAKQLQFPVKSASASSWFV